MGNFEWSTVYVRHVICPETEWQDAIRYWFEKTQRVRSPSNPSISCSKRRYFNSSCNRKGICCFWRSTWLLANRPSKIPIYFQYRYSVFLSIEILLLINAPYIIFGSKIKNPWISRPNFTLQSMAEIDILWQLIKVFHYLDLQNWKISNYSLDFYPKIAKNSAF